MTGGRWLGDYVCDLRPGRASSIAVAAGYLGRNEWLKGSWRSGAVLKRIRQQIHPDGVLFVPALESGDRDLLAGCGFEDISHAGPATRAWLESRTARPGSGTGWMVVRRLRRCWPSGSSARPTEIEGPPVVPVTYVVCVRDEAPRLPAFLRCLAASQQSPDANRRFVFVVNGCTDDSEQTLLRFAANRTDTEVVRSAPGITEAFVAGVQRADDAQLIGKLDADTTFEPALLDALEVAVIASADVRVAYAEPHSTGSANRYAAGEQDPSVLSARLYYVAKACLLQASLLRERRTQELMLQVRSDDIVLSSVIAMNFGLDAIRRVDGAFVHSPALSTFDDLVRQVSRTDSALQRLFSAAPNLAPLGDVFSHRILDPGYAELLDLARLKARYVEEWLRLESTKTIPTPT